MQRLGGAVLILLLSACGPVVFGGAGSGAQASSADREALLAEANMRKMLSAPESPVAQPFNDRAWMLKDEMHYTIGTSGVTVTIPKGFVTDFASIPRAFWLWIPPTGSYSRAAVVHDWLYWVQVCNREQSDKLLLLAMVESEVSVATRFTIYNAVRFFGERAWDGNTSEKSKGYIRMLLPPFDVITGNAMWTSYRERLRQQHAPEAAKPTDLTFCSLGDNREIL